MMTLFDPCNWLHVVWKTLSSLILVGLEFIKEKERVLPIYIELWEMTLDFLSFWAHRIVTENQKENEYLLDILSISHLVAPC